MILLGRNSHLPGSRPCRISLRCAATSDCRRDREVDGREKQRGRSGVGRFIGGLARADFSILMVLLFWSIDAHSRRRRTTLPSAARTCSASSDCTKRGSRSSWQALEGAIDRRELMTKSSTVSHFHSLLPSLPYSPRRTRARGRDKKVP